MGEVVLLDSENDNTLKMETEKDSGVERFEEYFPKMMMRVLLVESDDSTRQIIAALLRKCNYIVAAIPDGLKAWEILKRKHSSIDLILTEVDLPSISGYALLTLIMEHDGCRNIPVIMMSSSDSISMVFKCMLKGAADFLIKPVRRNELKNLWQHVWRRISQANNGSGVQNLQGGDGKAEASSKNRATRNCSEDNVSSSRQRSQPTEEASNDEGRSKMKHQGASNSSCNEVYHVEKGMRLGEDTEQEQSTRFESSRVAQEDEAYTSTLRLERVGSSSGRMDRNKRIHLACCKSMDNVHNGELNEYAGKSVIDLIGTIDNHHECTIHQSTSNSEIYYSSAAPHLELSLKRTNDPDNVRAAAKQKLNHSNAASFSRYSTCKNLKTIFPTSGISCAEINGGGNQMNSHDAPPKPVHAISSDEENKSTVMTGATMRPEPASPVPQVALAPIPGVGFGDMRPGYSPTYPLMFSPEACQGNICLKPTNHKESSPFCASTSLHSDQGTYCSSLRHSGFDETSNGDEKVISVDQQKYASGSASQSASSTFCSGGFATHLSQRNDNVNHPMVSTDNTDCGRVRENHGDMLMNGRHPRASGALQNPQREAALAKFRQKRKERCYGKKVRYQSRKRLAEQRPRVKGQFVRQVQMDQPHADTDNQHGYDGG